MYLTFCRLAGFGWPVPLRSLKLLCASFFVWKPSSSLPQIWPIQNTMNLNNLYNRSRLCRFFFCTKAVHTIHIIYLHMTMMTMMALHVWYSLANVCVCVCVFFEKINNHNYNIQLLLFYEIIKSRMQKSNFACHVWCAHIHIYICSYTVWCLVSLSVQEFVIMIIII